MNRAWLAAGLSLAVLGVAQELGPFKLHTVRFDESVEKNRPTPHIPKGWRLVSAEHGTRVNNNYLWFQDAAGSVFMVQGFMDGGFFIPDKVVNQIEVEK